ncbi:MAG: CocE/NonD family hydrolase, partial [Mycobacterium sp.]|nr:CocE/NonD family hydrolase [Mycobacterium sp.]
MGAASYVGRVGGLAVALGIGAAVLVGAGVAAAEDTGSASGASTSSSSSESTSSSAESTPSSTESTSSDTDVEPGADDEAVPEEDADPEEDVAEAADEDVPDDGAQEEGADQDIVDRDRDIPVEEPADEVVVKAEEEPVVEDLTEAPAEDEPPVETEAPAAEQQPVVAEPPAEAEPIAEAPAAVDEPAATVTAEVADVTAADAANETEDPALPALASLVMSWVTAGRELTDEPVTPAADEVTTSLAAADAAYPIPTGVEVIEWTPPLEWLQNVPVLGRLVVTPIVGVLHLIPLVGDFLHPLIGFAIDHDAPEGTPRPRSFIVKSFDGTRIFVNFMPAEGLEAGEKAPTVLSGSGLGLPGSTTLELGVDSFLPNDVIGIGALREAGYNVVTWDPRGEWRSGGRMQLQSPDFEGRDVSHIISHLATLSEVELDGENDPKLGMVGASYGGGIQLATAAIDHRIDAIVPTIAWNSLTDVLFPDEAVRSGWGTLLSSVLVLTLSRPHPRILPAEIVAIITGYASQSDIDLLNDRGYADQIGDITAPTLLIQGTVDTLFTLAQADLNAKALIEAGTTTKVLWYCGGHGACLSSHNDGDVVIGRTLDWLGRYVKGENVDTGAQFEWVDQNGDLFSSDTYPVVQGESVAASRSDDKSIPIFPFIGGSGPNP